MSLKNFVHPITLFVQNYEFKFKFIFGALFNYLPSLLCSNLIQFAYLCLLNTEGVTWTLLQWTSMPEPPSWRWCHVLVLPCQAKRLESQGPTGQWRPNLEMKRVKSKGLAGQWHPNLETPGSGSSSCPCRRSPSVVALHLRSDDHQGKHPQRCIDLCSPKGVIRPGKLLVGYYN